MFKTILLTLMILAGLSGCSDRVANDLSEKQENTDSNNDGQNTSDNQSDDNKTDPNREGNQIARITDSMTSDAGELRFQIDGASNLTSGKLSVFFLKQDNAVTADGNSKDAYIGLYGDSTSTKHALVDLRIQKDEFEIRDKSDITVPVTFTPNKWTQVDISWDANLATDEIAPTVSISIDGQTVTSTPFPSASTSLKDVKNGVKYVIFKLGDNDSTIPKAAYFIDDIKLYSDIEGSDLIFEDDFEGYLIGSSLETKNADSPYHSNSAEVFVTAVTEQGVDTWEPIDNLTCTSSYPLSASKIYEETAFNDLTVLHDENKTNSSVWSAHNLASSLIVELAEPARLTDLVITWKDLSRAHQYDVLSSTDLINWQSLLISGQSAKDKLIPDLIDLFGASEGKDVKYLKINFHGDDLSQVSELLEIEVYGCTTDVTHSVELIDWYLSVPTDEDGNGKSDSIKETDLDSGYFDPRFFSLSADGGLVFSTSVSGYKTSTNTKYVRSELREMLRRGYTGYKTQGVNGNNWVFSSAPQNDLDAAGGVDGRLEATLAVNNVTTTGEAYQIGRVIIGQIHANDDEPARLYYRKLPNNENGSIYLAHEVLGGDDVYYEIIGSRSNSASNPVDGIPLNEQFSYSIEVTGNDLDVIITKEDGTVLRQKVDMSQSGYDEGGQYMYFKAGVYNQNNSGDTHDYVKATFYQINNSHKGYLIIQD